MTEELRKAPPASMTEIERLEKQRKNLERLRQAMEAKLKAHPHDYGVKVWWGFVIAGLLVGWLHSRDVGSTLMFGLTFWVAGMFFCVFAIDSAEVESKIAIFLNRIGVKRIAEWLYTRALTIR
jgi:hypothetical protein